jgi:hypothetical protein
VKRNLLVVLTTIAGALSCPCDAQDFRALPPSESTGQPEPPGHSIGQISTTGDLIVIELGSAALGQPNLFDLVGRTLRFSPVGSSYRMTNEPLRWDTNYGVQLTGTFPRNS